MTPQKLYSFLVPPGKNNPKPEEVRGTQIPLSGRLYEMLSEVFLKSEKECTIPIRFVVGSDGKQQNDVRDQILELLKAPSLAKGQKLAERLHDVSTGKPGLGLLFIMSGNEGPTHKIVISRFPADQGVLAEAKKGSLEVEFVERVFMKNAASYKSAVYKGRSLSSDFWHGHSVDKQINAAQDDLRLYWIRDFLASDFRTTSKAGSKRLALALKSASTEAASINTKQEIVSAITLSQGFAGKSVSIDDLVTRFQLSEEATTIIRNQVPNEGLLGDTFNLDLEEFQRYATFESIELDNGGILTAPADRFDQTFSREPVNEADGRYRFSTTGRIVDQRIKSRR